MKQKYTLLNAFTQIQFNGAQIAVFSQADNLSQQQMLQLAKELNLTETVFISQPTLSGCYAKFEIYSPQGPCEFAGHAIVAACYLMADSGLVQGSNVKIELNGQVLNIIHSHKNHKVQINIPVNEKYDEYVPSNLELAQIVGIDVSLIGYKNYKPMIAGCPQPCLMIPLKHNDALREAHFYENKWQLSFVASLAKRVLLFTGEHPYSEINFAARLMGKGISINDDPPIGSVAPAFGLYLAYGINDYHRSCLIQRGGGNSRISIMEVNVDKVGAQVAELQLGGHAVKMAEGYFDIPDR
jgi:PhzF family phenazine biosynthesis protein